MKIEPKETPDIPIRKNERKNSLLSESESDFSELGDKLGVVDHGKKRKETEIAADENEEEEMDVNTLKQKEVIKSISGLKSAGDISSYISSGKVNLF